MKKGLLYALIASLLWSIVNPVIKQGLSYDFSPMNFAGLRFTLVGIVLTAYTWHRGMFKTIFDNWKLFLNLIVINIFFGYTAFYFGVDLVDSAISAIVMGVTPLVNVLLAHVIAKNDKLNRYKIISILVGLAGLLLIMGMGNNGAPLGWMGLLGIGCLFGNILCQGYVAILVSEDKSNIDPIFMNAVQMLIGGLMLYIVGVSVEGYHSFFDKPALFYLYLSILVCVSVFAFSLWFIALKMATTKVSDLNMCKLITPIIGAVLSWIMIDGEHPTFSTVVGMLIIVSSLLIYFKGEAIAKRLFK